ncbi:maker397 [Drosophila busckii]|uniref:Bsg25A n=1 Tax=Drosophila busckii TaxID=30019 RepID=A0A0M4E3E5_DROBS|nr:early boundary activity protein 1 [Drosophila busckii]ALC38118.1 Bsg25A [Drosophila busckii]ALC38121.1 Bsg25A [Drosophila busckii]ALC38123.1 maker397 [Drosophila busckii]
MKQAISLQATVAMINRRQRLEFALSILPYNHTDARLSGSQRQVEQIIARLRTDDTSAEEESDDEKQRRAQGFAEQTMRQIEQAELLQTLPKQKLSTLVTLTMAAEKLLKSQCKQEPQEEFDSHLSQEDSFADFDRRELLENSIEVLNAARIKMLQRWERSKRKALDLLTIEIDKVQTMDQAHSQRAAHFEQFCDGTDELNTSTPKTNDEDDDEEKENAHKQQHDVGFEIDDDDEEYVPYSNERPGKRKPQKKPVTSTPRDKRHCPGIEFDQDTSSPMVTIGPNGTQVARSCLQAINWNLSGPAITRKLLCEIFDRTTLAFHTLSGKPSPAFKDCARPSKQQLDPLKVADLVYLMTSSMEMTPREVRTAITTKCADENKMLRTRLQKRPRKTL